MSEFKVGDKVQCVDGYDEMHPIEGEIYTVEALIPFDFGTGHYIVLEEFDGGWYPDRFRKVE